MTLNDLINRLEQMNQNHTMIGWETLQFVAPLLRQQAQEIEALKKELALQRLSDIGQEIENEPVAHRFKWEEQEEWQYGDGYDATGAPNDPDYFAYEPLYTHPNEDRDSAIYATGYWNGIEYKRMRELTEDEIREVADSVCHTWKKNGVGELYMTDFARAILKKASEK